MALPRYYIYDFNLQTIQFHLYEYVYALKLHFEAVGENSIYLSEDCTPICHIKQYHSLHQYENSQPSKEVPESEKYIQHNPSMKWFI